MRKIRSFIIFLCALLLLVPLNMLVLAEDLDTTVTAGSHSIDAVVPYLGTAQITDNVKAAILYETTSDTLMYTYNADVQTFPSSMVKIMTALLAVEKGNLEQVVTVTESALASVPYYAASADLQAGEQISLRDLLYCMMVGSANDAAVVIAETISGSQEAFVAEMNRYAQEIGCTGTQFVNAHGLHDEQQYTTVRDMARIVSVAIKNNDFNTFFSAVSYVVPATNASAERELSSGNHLINTDSLQIYYDARVTGGRTGIADDGTRCLASCAQANGMNLICIVVGCESTFAEDGNTQTYGSFKETSTLFDAGFTGYRVVQVIHEDQALQQLSVVNGSNDVVLASKSSVYCVLPETVSVNDLRYQYENAISLQAPVKSGDVVSNVQVWYGNTCIAQAEVVSKNDVQLISIVQETPQEPAGKAGKVVTTILIIVLAIAGLFVAALFGVKYVRRALLKYRRKRYSRGRRRSR